jgi:methylated-DNA-protein-cysteine methyltransferase related protein
MTKSLIDSKKIIFKFLLSIPKGKVVTYGFVAKMCGLKNPRNVGWVLSQNEDPDTIPCYKVVRSNGSLATGYKFGGRNEQLRRLRNDGVLFQNQKVDTSCFVIL